MGNLFLILLHLNIPGKEEEVLFEQWVDDTDHKYLTGLTKRYAEVRVASLSPEQKVNTLMKCRIDRLSEDGILYGNISN